MSSNSLLARLTESERRSSGSKPGPDEESWIVRERRLFQIYFGMGLAASGITGAVALLVLLALATGPGYERWGWFGNTKAQSTLAPLYDALPRPVVAASAPVASAPDTQRAPLTDPQWAAATDIGQASVPQSTASHEPMAPPVVRVVSVTSVPVKPGASAPAAATQPAPAATQAPARKARPLQQAVKSEVVPAAAPAVPPLAAEPPRAEIAAGDPVQRPQGLLNLGGPGNATAAGEVDRVWWRRVWWGTAALPWMQPAVPSR